MLGDGQEGPDLPQGRSQESQGLVCAVFPDKDSCTEVDGLWDPEVVRVWLCPATSSGITGGTRHAKPKLRCPHTVTGAQLSLNAHRGSGQQTGHIGNNAAASSRARAQMWLIISKNHLTLRLPASSSVKGQTLSPRGMLAVRIKLEKIS